MPSKMSSTNQLGKKLTEQFWLDTRIPLSNDLDDWRKLSNKKRLSRKSLWWFDPFGYHAIWNRSSGPSPDIRTPHEEAVFNNIQFMESVHAKSYSSIFSTLNTKAEIEEIFEWTNTNPYLQRKAEINEIYLNGTPLKKEGCQCLPFETFLFYSGFFTRSTTLVITNLPMLRKLSSWLSVMSLFTELTLVTNSTCFKNCLKKSKKTQRWMYDRSILYLENEEGYTESLYDGVGWRRS